jgi:hypothetical protein
MRGIGGRGHPVLPIYAAQRLSADTASGSRV